nr:11682_t:CDS:2 [Entrophospora candida]
MEEKSPDFFLKPNEKFQNIKTYQDVISLLDALNEREITGSRAIFAICHFLHKVCKEQENKDLMFKIIDKNLKIGLNKTILNRLFLEEEFITFQVALPQARNIQNLKKIFKDEIDWYASKSLDGIRCITKISSNGKSVISYSKNGKPFDNLGQVEEAVKNLYEKNKKYFSTDEWSDGIVLDGELLDRCNINNTNNGDVGDADELQFKDVKYFIFDCLTKKEFLDRKGYRSFGERYEFTKKLFCKAKKNKEFEKISLVDQHKIKNENVLEKFIEEGINEGCESIILRKDIGYEGRRSNSYLRFKPSREIEAIVEDVKLGKMVIPIENNRSEDGVTFSSVIVNYRDNLTSVNLGFTNKQRIYYKENPGSIKGKKVTIKYFEDSNKKNKTLRFPSAAIANILFRSKYEDMIRGKLVICDNSKTSLSLSHQKVCFEFLIISLQQ